MTKAMAFFLGSCIVLSCNREEWVYDASVIEGYEYMNSIAANDTIVVMLPDYPTLPLDEADSITSPLATLISNNWLPYPVARPLVYDDIDENFFYQYHISEEDATQRIQASVVNIYNVIQQFKEEGNTVFVIAPTDYGSMFLLNLLSYHELNADKYCGYHIRLYTDRVIVEKLADKKWISNISTEASGFSKYVANKNMWAALRIFHSLIKPDYTALLPNTNMKNKVMLMITASSRFLGTQSSREIAYFNSTDLDYEDRSDKEFYTDEILEDALAYFKSN